MQNESMLLLIPVAAMIAFFAIWFPVMRYLGRRARQTRAVTKIEGQALPAMATVLQITDTGLRNHRIYILVRLRLAVHGTRDFEPFEAETLAAISPIQAPAYARGSEVRVKVDASDHRRVVVDQPIR